MLNTKFYRSTRIFSETYFAVNWPALMKKIGNSCYFKLIWSYLRLIFYISINPHDQSMLFQWGRGTAILQNAEREGLVNFGVCFYQMVGTQKFDRKIRSHSSVVLGDEYQTRRPRNIEGEPPERHPGWGRPLFEIVPEQKKKLYERRKSTPVEYLLETGLKKYTKPDRLYINVFVQNVPIYPLKSCLFEFNHLNSVECSRRFQEKNGIYFLIFATNWEKEIFA